MGAGSITLRGLADGSGRITLGVVDAVPVQNAHVSINARLPGLRRVSLRTVVYAGVNARLPGLKAQRVSYASEAARPLAGVAASSWQLAQSSSEPCSVVQTSAAAAHEKSAASWQQAVAARHSVTHRLPPLLVSQQRSDESRYATAVLLRAAASITQQSAVRSDVRRSSMYQRAAGLVGQIAVRNQAADQSVRVAQAAAWALAQAHRIVLYAGYGRGMPHLLLPRTCWQLAMRPGPGISVLPPVLPPRPVPCYDPATIAQIVLRDKADGTGRITLRCERGGVAPPKPRYVIPLLDVYMSYHSLSAVLLPSLEPVALADVSISSDDGGYGWSLTANGAGHLLEQLAPVGSLPVRVRVTLDGFDWVFAVRAGRTRSFGKWRCAVRGSSVTSLLGAEYMTEQSWLSSSSQTAAQLVAAALDGTGTTIDWGIDDWLVPAGVWSFVGAPLQAARRIADSVGAVLRSHRTEQQLIFAPRYPVLPWLWDEATPDVQMVADAITTDDYQPEPGVLYNAVHVYGQHQGFPGYIVREGSAGDLMAPAVTDALITEIAAARQRGCAILGAAAGTQVQRMTLPFLTGGSRPGPMLPGYLVAVDDVGESWRGLVRSISISASMPKVRQTITVERTP